MDVLWEQAAGRSASVSGDLLLVPALSLTGCWTPVTPPASASASLK